MQSIYSVVTPEMAYKHRVNDNSVKVRNDGTIFITSPQGDVLGEFESEREYLAHCKFKELTKLLRDGAISANDFANEMSKL